MTNLQVNNTSYVESVAQKKVPIKTEPSWDSVSVEYAPFCPVFIKEEPPSDGSVEVRSSSLDVSIKEEIVNTEASCLNGIETPLNVTVKAERENEEWCEVSVEATAGLYAGHIVKEELALGPVLVERRDALSTDKGQAPQEKQDKRWDTYRCDHCDYTTARKCALAAHMKTHREHTKKQYKCDQCCFTTDRKNSFTKHEKIHTSGRRYKCARGSYAAVSKGQAPKKKQDRRHDTYRCAHCVYTTPRKCALAAHMKTHIDTLPRKCALAAHMKTHIDTLVCKKVHTEKQYKCDQCCYTTVHKRHLTGHKKNHPRGPRERQYKCDRCSYAAFSRGHLIRHHRTHTDVQLHFSDRYSLFYNF